MGETPMREFYLKIPLQGLLWESFPMEALAFYTEFFIF